MASESPTRIMSAPAPSTVRAEGASYAVTITSGESPALRAAMSGAVIRRAGEVAISALPPPSRAHSAPGGPERVPNVPVFHQAGRPDPAQWRRDRAGLRELCDGRRRTRPRAPRLRRAARLGRARNISGRARARAVVHLMHLAIPL